MISKLTNKEKSKIRRKVDLDLGIKPPKSIIFTRKKIYNRKKNIKKMNEKIEVTKYLTVLDFEVSKVWQYTLMGEGWNPDHEACEDFIASKGHRLNNCEWMLHEDATLHRETITN